MTLALLLLLFLSVFIPHITDVSPPSSDTPGLNHGKNPRRNSRNPLSFCLHSQQTRTGTAEGKKKQLRVRPTFFAYKAKRGDNETTEDVDIERGRGKDGNKHDLCN